MGLFTFGDMAGEHLTDSLEDSTEPWGTPARRESTFHEIAKGAVRQKNSQDAYETIWHAELV